MVLRSPCITADKESRIRYALAGNNIEAEYALGESDVWYDNSSRQFTEYVDKEMPTQRCVHWVGDGARTSKADRTPDDIADGSTPSVLSPSITRARGRG
jgi:hypothetical protein